MFAEPWYRFAKQSERRGTKHTAIAITACLLALAAVPAAPRADEASNPAHALAEKFSRASGDTPKPAQPSRTAKPTLPATPKIGIDAQANARAEQNRRAAEEQRAYEEDMLARARADAEARLQADMAREQEAARQRAHAAEEARQRTDAERLAHEREAESRVLAERLRAARRARDEARVRAAAETEAKAQADARRDAAHDALRQRTQRIAAKLAEIRTHREHQARSAPAPQMTEPTHPTVETADRPTTPDTEEREARYAPASRTGTADSADADPRHATVLLVMKPGNRGIRRWNKTADPMLCIDDSCYISAGAETAARRVTRRKGFGPGIALGTRAGACNDQLACVFRNVDLVNDHAWMQPVDLRIVRHDRRESRRISTDPTCTLSDGRIACARTIESDDYRAWIVPEDVARHAGADALKAALDNRLQGNVMARSPHY